MTCGGTLWRGVSQAVRWLQRKGGRKRWLQQRSLGRQIRETEERKEGRKKEGKNEKRKIYKGQQTVRGDRLLGVGREIFWGRKRSFQEGFWLVA